MHIVYTCSGQRVSRYLLIRQMYGWWPYTYTLKCTRMEIEPVYYDDRLPV